MMNVKKNGDPKMLPINEEKYLNWKAIKSI